MLQLQSQNYKGYSKPLVPVDNIIYIKSEYEKKKLRLMKNDINVHIRKTKNINSMKVATELAQYFSEFANSNTGLANNISCFVSPFTRKQNGLQK